MFDFLKMLAVIICSVVALFLFSFGVKMIFFPVNTVNKMVDTAYDAVGKTINADNAIYNYEWFKQQKQDIEATKQKYDNAAIAVDNFKEMAGPYKDYTFEDKNEMARLQSIKVGTKNILEQQIADYNARASMANRSIFQDSILPSFIDSLTFITK